MPPARRDFLKAVAAVPLAPAALAPPALPAVASGAAPTGNEAVAEALAEAVKRQFGAHLGAGELEAVKKELAQDLDRATRLVQAAQLRNADEPVSRFEARPPETKGQPR
jgi:hypothetical protein